KVRLARAEARGAHEAIEEERAEDDERKDDAATDDQGAARQPSRPLAAAEHGVERERHHAREDERRADDEHPAQLGDDRGVGAGRVERGLDALQHGRAIGSARAERAPGPGHATVTLTAWSRQPLWA